MNAIELAHVNKRYGEFALEDVCFALPQGCVLGLVGENGAGKSTLIRMMLGACQPDSGAVYTLGVKAGRSGEFNGVKQEIGVVLDEACLPGELTAAQVGRFMRGVYAKWDQAAFEGYVKRFDLPKDKQVKHFSRGTKMKLAIAIALSHHAKLLVLDEATGGLDPVVRDDILDLFNEFTRDETHSILLSSHIVSDLEKICDYIVFLSKGRVLMMEEKDAIREKYAMLTLSESEYESLDSACVVRVLRSRGAVNVLALREKLPTGMEVGRTTIEDVMLMLTKGEKRA